MPHPPPPTLIDEPTPEEVIELCEKLQARNSARPRDYALVLTVLLVGMLVSFVGLSEMMGRFGAIGWTFVLGISLIVGGVVGVVFLANPLELIRITRSLQASSDPNVIPPLLDALTLALQVSKNGSTIRQLRRTLAVQILRLSVNDSVVLREEHWEVLYRHLNSHTALRLTVDADDFAFTLAILDLITRRRDTRYIGTIRGMMFGFGTRGKQLREMTKECLVVLEEQKRKEDESRILLRASQPKAQSETLLRPAGYSSDAQAQELLRADLSQHS